MSQPTFAPNWMLLIVPLCSLMVIGAVFTVGFVVGRWSASRRKPQSTQDGPVTATTEPPSDDPNPYKPSRV